MPRLIVPRSTRTMYGNVTPALVVVDATDAAGVVPVTYGWKHELAGVAGVGLAIVGVGSGSTNEQPPSPATTRTGVLVRYQSLNSVAILHCASVATVDKPLAFEPGVLPTAATGTGVAQTHGPVCEPSSTGPPIGWLVMTSCAPTKLLSDDFALIVLVPFVSPVTMPIIRPLALAAKADVMSVPSRSTFRLAADTDAGSLTSTRAEQ